VTGQAQVGAARPQAMASKRFAALFLRTFSGSKIRPFIAM
jgi:hypothetical protein